MWLLWIDLSTYIVVPAVYRLQIVIQNFDSLEWRLPIFLSVSDVENNCSVGSLLFWLREELPPKLKTVRNWTSRPLWTGVLLPYWLECWQEHWLRLMRCCQVESGGIKEGAEGLIWDQMSCYGDLLFVKRRQCFAPFYCKTTWFRSVQFHKILDIDGLRWVFSSKY